MRMLCSIVSAVALLAAARMGRAADDRPNVIAVVTDDQARWALGCYGNADVRTPNMDRLAREGAKFTNAITVTPVCSPSRAAYMSGRWPSEVGITDYLAPQESDAGLGLSAPIWPAVLQQSGYATALIGKWHLGTKPEFHPTRKGFSRFMGFLGGGNTPMNPTLEVNGQETQLTGSLPDLLVDDAIEFIRTAPRPFALCLHFRAPHLPYTPVPEVDSAPFRDLDPEIPALSGLDLNKVKQAHRDYYSSISSVDRNLGRLLAALDELKLADNTLVTFTSDHGYNEGRHYLSTKGNGKWIVGGLGGPTRPNMFETSITVPLLARWPKVIKPGTIIDYPASIIDTFRTILGATQVPAPQDAPARGVDLSPLLRGEKMPARPAMFGQYDLHNGGLAYLRMIRTDRYKYIKAYRANMLDELYDLQSDPGEEQNLIGRRGRGAGGKILQGLDTQLVEWQRSINDPLLQPAPLDGRTR